MNLQELHSYLDKGIPLCSVKTLLTSELSELTEMSFLNSIIKKGFQEVLVRGDGLYRSSDGDWQEALFTEKLFLSIRWHISREKKQWNYNCPFVSFSIRLEKMAFRISIIHPSLSYKGVWLCSIRELSSDYFSLERYGLEKKSEGILCSLVLEKKNIIIAGATASGKTSFMKSLISYIPKTEHPIILEDTPEILLEHDAFSFLSPRPNSKDNLSDLCAYSLRLNPSRLILGEMRSREVIPFVLAMNTGHNGLLSTVHANSAEDAVSRIATMFSIYSEHNISYERILSLIAKNIDYCIFMDAKKLEQIIEVKGASNGRLLYQNVSF